MEIKAELLKPYTEEQKLNFIVEQNHKNGYEIRETETALEAWGYTEEEKQAQERERIQELFMTRSDFFDGTIMAWGIGEDELLVVIQRMLMGLSLDNVSKLKAVNNFKNALNFYRKHPLFNLLVNVPIQLTENVQIVIAEEHLDNFFNEVANGNKETAWQYLPQPTLIPIEPPVEEPMEEVVEPVEPVEVTDETNINL